MEQENMRQGRAFRVGKTAALGLALALAPFGPAVGVVSFALAEAHEDDGGHEDGGHEDGGGEDGGHEDGVGGQGGGGQGAGGQGNGGQGGGHGEDGPVVIATDAGGRSIPLPTNKGFFSVPVGANFGPYISAELGLGMPMQADAYWLPPGSPADPQVFFDLDADRAGFGGIAVGYDVVNGFRGELALNVFGASDFAGDWSYTVPETAGPHASMYGTVNSIALMVNGYYAPLAGDAGQAFQPYITAGIGMANNTVEEWTRINPDPTADEREFVSNTTSDLALSVGFGVSVDLETEIGGQTPTLDIGYRYFDLGTAVGGAETASGSGGVPVEPLTFGQSAHVISIGIRIPLGGF